MVCSSGVPVKVWLLEVGTGCRRFVSGAIHPMHSAMTRDSLRLDGDEGVEEAIEAAFDVTFSQSELISICNVGELHQALMARLPPHEGKCETSMSFYRLRRGMVQMGMEGRIRPNTPLPATFFEGPKAKFAQLSGLTRLRLPPPVVGPIGMMGLALCLAALALGVLAIVLGAVELGLLFPIAAFFAVVCLRSDRGRLPNNVRTVGDLSRRAAVLNYGQLVRQGARSNDDVVWAVLVEILGDVAEAPPSEIGRETRFFADRKAAA